VAQVAVVIPARDEETLMPGCLEAVAVAVDHSPVPVRTIVVLDTCRDRTADVCASFGVETVVVSSENVGRARHAGATRAIGGRTGTGSIWIANTDADSRVAPDWVDQQVRLADDGADVLLGLAEVTFDVPAVVISAHRAGYQDRIRVDGTHHHVHGANLGIRASTYLAAGGFPPLTDHEDQQLVLRARALGDAAVVATTSLVVETSGRRAGRCRHGVARTMADLMAATYPSEVRRPA
jgi:glycosyltransferase involved in cell wall biosynthesis